MYYGRRMGFDDVSLARLRLRRSEKWTSYPDDVLPAFYAEMDFDPAEPVVRALTQAIENRPLGVSQFFPTANT